MNQHDQMREALREIEKKAHDSEGASGSTEVDRWFAEIGFLAKQALAAETDHIPDAAKMVAAVKECVTAQPAPLARLDEGQLEQLGCSYAEDFDFANAIMDAMEFKNKR